MSKILKNELLEDPLKLGYSELGEEAVSEVLNKKNRFKLASVSRASFAIWAARGPRAVIEDLANDRESPFRSSALTLKDFLVGAADALDLTDPNVMELLVAWRSAGMLTQSEYDQLIEAGTIVCSRATELGLGTIYASQVRDAR